MSEPLSLWPASTCTSLISRRCQVAQHRRQVDLARRVWQVDHDGATCFQGSLALGVLNGRIDEEPASGNEDLRIGRRLEPAVDHHRVGLARSRGEPHIQPRVVFEQGADAGEHNAGPGPPGVTVRARGLGRDPLARAVIQRRLAIQRCRDLHAQPRCAPHHPAEKPDIEFTRLGRPRAGDHLDARLRAADRSPGRRPVDWGRAGRRPPWRCPRRPAHRSTGPCGLDARRAPG